MPDTFTGLPAYYPDIQELARKQAMADALRQMAMQPLQGQAIGGRAVPIHPMQGLAQLAQALMSSRMQSGIDERSKGLSQQIMGTRQQTLANALRGGGPDQARTAMELMGSGDPALTQVGAKIFETHMKAQEPRVVGANASLVTGTGKPIFTNQQDKVKWEQGGDKLIPVYERTGQAVPGLQPIPLQVSPNTTATLGQAERHWGNLSEDQRQRLLVERAGLGLRAQGLGIERAGLGIRAGQYGWETGQQPPIAIPPAPGTSLPPLPLQAPAQAPPQGPVPAPQAVPQPAPGMSPMGPPQPQPVIGARPAAPAAPALPQAAGGLSPKALQDSAVKAREQTSGLVAKALEENYARLRDVPQQLQNIEQAKALVPQAGGFMGPGGEPLLYAAKFMNDRLGTSINTEGVKSAEELRTRIFMNVMDNLKKMDAQPSQLQQQIMQQALGSLGTDPSALPRMLDAYGDALKGRVQLYHRQVDEASKIGVNWPHRIGQSSSGIRVVDW